MERKVKFGVCADVHAASVVGGEERVAAFLDACRKADVDFIIELGDFCTPGDIPEVRKKYLNKDNVIAMYRDFEKPSYHVLGNHDMDTCDKKTVLEYYGTNKDPYYSFDMGGFHFVAIDNNNYMCEGEVIEYDKANYMRDKRDNKILGYIPREQLDWLKEDLSKTANPSILFAHYPLNFMATYLDNIELKENYDEFTSILQNSPGGAYMCLNGHTHLDHIYRTDNIWQYTINSMSNCWIGTSFPCPGRYTEEIDQAFGSIKYTTPYRDAVYAIIEMDDDGAMVKGTKSEIVGPTAEELGVYTHKTVGWNQKRFPVYITAQIMDRYIKFIK